MRERSISIVSIVSVVSVILAMIVCYITVADIKKGISSTETNFKGSYPGSEWSQLTDSNMNIYRTQYTYYKDGIRYVYINPKSDLANEGNPFADYYTNSEDRSDFCLYGEKKVNNNQTSYISLPLGPKNVGNYPQVFQKYKDALISEIPRTSNNENFTCSTYDKNTGEIYANGGTILFSQIDEFLRHLKNEGDITLKGNADNIFATLNSLSIFSSIFSKFNLDSTDLYDIGSIVRNLKENMSSKAKSLTIRIADLKNPYSRTECLPGQDSSAGCLYSVGLDHMLVQSNFDDVKFFKDSVSDDEGSPAALDAIFEIDGAVSFAKNLNIWSSDKLSFNLKVIEGAQIDPSGLQPHTGQLKISDSHGNSVYSQELLAPSITLDYKNEKFASLNGNYRYNIEYQYEGSDSKYTLFGCDQIIDESNVDSMSTLIDDNYDVQITVRKCLGMMLSNAQTAVIKHRPNAPTKISYSQSSNLYTVGEVRGLECSEEYRLVGDEEWSPVCTDGVVKSTGYSIGKYEFRFQSTVSSPSSKPVVIYVTAIPRLSVNNQFEMLTGFDDDMQYAISFDSDMTECGYINSLPLPADDQDHTVRIFYCMNGEIFAPKYNGATTGSDGSLDVGYDSRAYLSLVLHARREAPQVEVLFEPGEVNEVVGGVTTNMEYKLSDASDIWHKIEKEDIVSGKLKIDSPDKYDFRYVFDSSVDNLNNLGLGYASQSKTIAVNGASACQYDSSVAAYSDRCEQLQEEVAKDPCDYDGLALQDLELCGDVSANSTTNDTTNNEASSNQSKNNPSTSTGSTSTGSNSQKNTNNSANNSANTSIVNLKLTALKTVTNKIKFKDLSSVSSARKKSILWLAKKGIAASATSYNPNNKVTKGAMAQFIWKLLGSKDCGKHGPVTVEKYFIGDKNMNSLKKSNLDRYNSIQWIAEKGIVSKNGKFNPNKAITRSEMAKWLYSIALHLGKVNNNWTPSKSFAKHFVDVNSNNSTYIAIGYLFEKNITTGTKVNKKNYFNPNSSVTRGAMAEFLNKFYQEEVK